MKFLEEHFKISWEIAVQNFKLLYDGLVDLSQKKSFVSSLQNAIELGFKQILIDIPDYRVIALKIKTLEDVEFARKYLNVTDLNDFLINCSQTEIERLYSIEFNQLIEIISKLLLNEGEQPITEELNLLKKLRNSETHFFVSDENYLSFGLFKMLCKLINRCHSYFLKKGLITYSSWGSATSECIDNLSYVGVDLVSLTSYRDLIANSETNKMIMRWLPMYDQNRPKDGYVVEGRSLMDKYEIARDIYYNIFSDESIPDFPMRFDEFYRRFVILVKEELILLTETVVERPSIADDEIETTPEQVYAVSITRSTEV